MKIINRLHGILGALLLIGITGPAAAQQPGYGPSVNLETAKKMAMSPLSVELLRMDEV